jgi:transketolase
VVADGRPTREAYGEALVQLGRERQDVVVVEADISKSTKTMFFAKEFPERFVNVGVAEQNAMMVAAGLASCGKIPFVSTYAIFGTMRAAEQVRTFIAYADLNVKIALSHGGLTPGNDGATHQGTEDFGVFRTIPNMTVIMPADAHATKQAVRAAAEWKGPVYLRFTRDAVPYIYSESECPFTIGKANVLRRGGDVTLIAIGDMVSVALEAAQALADTGVSAGVVDMHTLKPLDVDAVLEAAAASGAIVTVEDHNILNGLGSAVCEVVAERRLVPVKRIGIPDQFGQSGPYERLLEHYGLSAGHVVAAAREVITRKTSRP